MKPILIKSLCISIIVLAFTFGIAGCSDPEAEARKMQNEAITAERDGRQGDAKRIYEEIVAKYPGTQASVAANQYLLSLNFKFHGPEIQLPRIPTR